MHRIAPLAAVVLVSAACAAAKPKPAATAAAKPAAPAAAVAQASAAKTPAAAPAAAAPAMPTGKTIKLSATVSSVDAKAGTVTVTGHGATHVFRVAQGAKLTKGGDWAKISLSDFSAGDRLTLSYAGDVLASAHVKVMAASGAASTAKVAKADKTSKKG